VWSIAGQSHHTIAIEQSNRIVLVEAPQSEARSLAAIAKARELNPSKPVETVVNTHHHFDHSGGLRAAISQGLTIVTHQGNKDFYEKVLHPRRHFIQTDALSQNPKPLHLVSVRDRYVMRDSLRSIEIHPIVGNDHSGSMLVVYLPAERVLIQADLYNPPAPNAVNPVFPFAANLVSNIQRLGLQVDRVVGIHGRPVPYSELQAAASRAP
jgi:glyoxylase-like metal-dependent hydrolase (beta-lactamase superfamily II)